MTSSEEPAPIPQRSRAARVAWSAAGLVAVAIGGIGAVVPGLPTTVFFIVAASCFSRSSPRLERWVLGLPGVGPMVADYRAGLGMPRRAKMIAITMIAAVIALSTLFLIDSTTTRLIVIIAGAVGVVYILWWVPTRERVLAERAADEGHAES